MKIDWNDFKVPPGKEVEFDEWHDRGPTWRRPARLGKFAALDTSDASCPNGLKDTRAQEARCKS